MLRNYNILKALIKSLFAGNSNSCLNKEERVNERQTD